MPRNVALRETLVVKPEKTLFSKITQFPVRSHMIHCVLHGVFL